MVELDRTLERAADALRLPPWDASVASLSGGERRRVALCRLLLRQARYVAAGQPTNHLDAESVGWLEQFLQEFPGTVVAITHDRYFLDKRAGSGIRPPRHPLRGQLFQRRKESGGTGSPCRGSPCQSDQA